MEGAAGEIGRIDPRAALSYLGSRNLCTRPQAKGRDITI